MTATPYKATLTVALGNPRGPKKNISYTASDVADESLLNSASESNNVISGSSDVWITDLTLSASGVDTSQIEFYLNGTSTGFSLLDATSLATTVGRPFQNAPFKIPMGAQLKMVQKA